ncbi:homocysteine S-methyltransferase family protein [Sneathiella limimaris]|uniref:homocysteine S-methyltransferase family protein n=1 Tax=Sneathiella limimaris TaxID=1964213 RepID=UPI00146D4F6F|nr:homocysteine S-methyltransferase family protein [Sneathiella limimaris]
MKHSQMKADLPQLEGKVFLTDGGLETTMIFHEGIDLPLFAACEMLKTEAEREILKNYFRSYTEIAAQLKTGIVLETATWRASRDWMEKLGHNDQSIRRINLDAVALLKEIREEYETIETPVVISGNLGPRGDGYDPGEIMTEVVAEAYHSEQVGFFKEAGVDLVSAITLTNVPEAVGFVRAAQKAELPVVVAFTVETDGRLPTGQSLGDAILEVDRATGNGPAYYMINCAHPTHFEQIFGGENAWAGRIKGLRANASCMSHEELDNAEELDDGDPVALAGQYRELMDVLPGLSVLGGCCGTDHRHVAAIGGACVHSHHHEDQLEGKSDVRVA